MSVINRIEISNYLNLDNRRPSEQQWIPHWRHVAINARGLSTAIVATNGVGKSTANKAIYAILTRDRTFVAESRERAAPKRRGLWSHVRIEVLYQDVSEFIQPGLIGDAVRGEAYVIGFYGFSDEELHFYHYLGHLEQCPVVDINGHLKRMISNAEFLTTLKGCDGVAFNLPVVDWKRFIHRHFDPSLIHQLVNYQKAGGGDGAENFFKVQRRNGEDYDSAFFYTHIAPEVLVNCMDVFGEEGEYRFEDTLLESARPVLAAQRKAEDRAKAVKEARFVFEGLEVVKEKADAYLTTQGDLSRTIAASFSEAAFIQKIVEKDPILGIPQPLRTQSPDTAFIADRLVCSDGTWLIPDKVISEIFASEAKLINQEASEKQLPSVMLKPHQVIEKPTYHGSLERGAPNRGYGREAVLVLIENRKRFAENWDTDKAKRAINYAFDWQTTTGEPNSLRSAANRLTQEQLQLKKSIEEKKKRRFDCAEEHSQLQDQLQNMQAAETALSTMRQSSLFSGDELAEPLATQSKVFAQQDDAINAREAHKLHHAQLREYRDAHSDMEEEFPNRMPDDVRNELILLNDQASSALKRATDDQATSTWEYAEAQTSNEAAQLTLSIAKSKHTQVTTLLPKVKLFEAAFPGESADGLQAFVQEQLSSAERRHEALKTTIEQLELEDQTLAGLLGDVEHYHSRFNDEDPHTVASNVGRDLEAGYALEKDAVRRQEETQIKLVKLKDGFQALNTVHRRFGINSDVPDLERTLADEFAQRTGEKNALSADIEALDPLVQAAEDFESRFGNLENASSTAASRAKRLPLCGRMRDQKTAKLEDLQRQRAELEKARAAAGSIAQEVLSCVGKTLPRVHQIIEDLEISPKRRAQVLVHFSQVLHAPVVSDTEAAHAALKALDAAGLEAPIFFESELIRFCHQGDLTEKHGLTYSFMIGAPTLQARALINPAEIENVKASLDRQIAGMAPQVEALENEYADLSPESETSHLIRLACTAFERQAPVALFSARQSLRTVEIRLRELEEQRSEKVILLIRSATEFLCDGGEKTLITTEESLAALAQELKWLRDQLPTLELRASAESSRWIDATCRFLDKGGATRLSWIRDRKAQHETELSDIAKQLPILHQRVSQLPIIQAAEEFLTLGGWEWATSIAKEVEHAQDACDECETLLEQIKSICSELNTRVALLQQNASSASSHLVKWEKPLIKAQEYINQDGPAFDATYKQKGQILQIEVDNSIQRTRFDFKHAQQAVNDARVPNGRTQLIERRDYLLRELTSLEQDISDAQERHENQMVRLQALQNSAAKIDQAVIGILRQWRMVRDLLDVISSDQVSGSEVESIYLQSAKALHLDLVEQVDIGDLDAQAELFDSLASDISNFPLNEHRTKLASLRQQLNRQFSELTRELDRVRKNHENQLSVTEQEALASDRTPQAVLKDANQLYRHFENYLLNMERLHGQSEVDLQEARERLVASISGFTDGLGENFKLLKTVLDRRDTGGIAGLHIAGELIDRNAVSEEIDAVVRELDRQQRRRDEDKAAGKTMGSDTEFEETLKQDIRATFYRTVFRAPKDSDATGPTVTFQHPEIASGRPVRLTPKLSTGQGNALALLILTKLADFTLHRDALADAGSIDTRRRIKPSATRVVMIDGLFSNLSDKKMIRHSLSVIRTLKGSFQLIGWIHNELYENDPNLFPSYCALRRVGGERGFVLVDDSASKEEMFHEGEIKSIELHVDQLRE
ncbi:hypothetical protein [Pseudomonas sp. NPDC087336]|uniref:hypothetical protein n=1 Tax=Pseudomonas sp. NPDC087336 TaxID=3364436 RepID=UPI00381FEA39